jgi:hypothetical protein
MEKEATRRREEEKRHEQDAALRTAVYRATALLPEMQHMQTAREQVAALLNPSHELYDPALTSRYERAVQRLKAQEGHLTRHELRIVLEGLFGRVIEVELSKNKRFRFIPHNALAVLNTDLEASVEHLDETKFLAKLASAKTHMAAVRGRYCQAFVLYEKLIQEVPLSEATQVLPFEEKGAGDVTMYYQLLVRFLVRLCGKVVALPNDTHEGDAAFTVLQKACTRLASELYQSFGVHFDARQGMIPLPSLQEDRLDGYMVQREIARFMATRDIVAPLLNWYDAAGHRVVSSARTRPFSLPAPVEVASFTIAQEDALDDLEEESLELDSSREEHMRTQFTQLVEQNPSLHEALKTGGPAAQSWQVQAQVNKTYNQAAHNAATALRERWEALQKRMRDDEYAGVLSYCGLSLSADGALTLLPQVKALAASVAEARSLTVDEVNKAEAAFLEYQRFSKQKDRIASLYTAYWSLKNFFDGGGARHERNVQERLARELGELPAPGQTHAVTPEQMLQQFFAQTVVGQLRALANRVVRAADAEKEALMIELYTLTKHATAELYRRTGTIFYKGRMVLMPSRFTVPPVDQRTEGYRAWGKRLNTEDAALRSTLGLVTSLRASYQAVLADETCRSHIDELVKEEYAAPITRRKKNEPRGYGGTGWVRDHDDARAAWQEARRKQKKKEEMLWRDNPLWTRTAPSASSSEKKGSLSKLFKRKTAAIPASATKTVSPLHDGVSA